MIAVDLVALDSVVVVGCEIAYVVVVYFPAETSYSSSAAATVVDEKETAVAGFVPAAVAVG